MGVYFGPRLQFCTCSKWFSSTLGFLGNALVVVLCYRSSYLYVPMTFCCFPCNSLEGVLTCSVVTFICCYISNHHNDISFNAKQSLNVHMNWTFYSKLYMHVKVKLIWHLLRLCETVELLVSKTMKFVTYIGPTS